MKKLNQYIKHLVEQETAKRFPMPPEIKDALQNKLKMNPLPRFIKNLKAVNSIPASYRVFLHNNNFFDIIYEEYSLMVKIKTNEYYLADLDERNYAIKDINKLLTGPIKKKEDEEEEDDFVAPPKPKAKPATPATPPPPPPPPTPEPEA
jgi:hypothetical protein